VCVSVCECMYTEITYHICMRVYVLMNTLHPTHTHAHHRYNQIEAKLSPFLKKWGYNTKKDVIYCPCSGLTGANLKEKMDPAVWICVRVCVCVCVCVFK
jgi:translation elongation factor EF-1alpha